MGVSQKSVAATARPAAKKITGGGGGAKAKGAARATSGPVKNASKYIKEQSEGRRAGRTPKK